MNSNLLLDSHPLVVLPELAVAIGLDEAIVLQQIHYWCRLNARNRRNYRDGNYWTRNSMPQWREQFPWYKKSKLERTFASLKEKGLIIIGNYNKLPTDRTNWYRVNYDTLQMLINASSPQNEVMEHLELKSPLPETNTEKNKNQFFAPQAAKKTCFVSDEPAPCDIDIPEFIKWYYALYMVEREEKHPRIKSPQEQRVTTDLTNFLNEYPAVDAGGLRDMARDFFETADSNDWRINHFATPGILEICFYHVYK